MSSYCAWQGAERCRGSVLPLGQTSADRLLAPHVSLLFNTACYVMLGCLTSAAA